MNNEAQPAPPCILVIFGGAGDLTKRLLAPALYNLEQAGLLPKNFAVIGVARTDMDDDSFQKEIGAGLDTFATGEVLAEKRKWLIDRMFYIQADFDDKKGYETLKSRLAEVDADYKIGGNVLFYLATPAGAFETIIDRLGGAGLVEQRKNAWRRVIVEKPFGHDLPSARKLNKNILKVLSEDQVYRIDHYLGKETVQNIFVFRFGNGIFEPLWNRDHINHVQITVAETVGVETRGKFYDATGALRDMVPNHLCQLLSLIAMEPPGSFTADALRTEKTKVLSAVQAYKPEEVAENVVRAQYGGGEVSGKKVVPYLQSPDVAPDSTTETYVAMKLMIDNWRWAGVPFYIRTGKALGTRQSEIAIQFKQAPYAVFRDTPIDRLTHNDLILHIQPEESVTLRFSAKMPGPRVKIGGVEMKFNYRDFFKASPSTGYETLIYDCMKGDAILFQRADNIEAGWCIVQPVLEAWAAADKDTLPSYTAGSAGPKEADELMARDGRHWRRIDGTTDVRS